MQDGDYVETTKKFEVQYENMEEYLKKLVARQRKKKKKAEENQDEE